jgi:hypothetical protein
MDMDIDKSPTPIVKITTVPVLTFAVIGLVVFSIDSLVCLLVLAIGAGTEFLSQLTHINTTLGLYHSGTLGQIIIWAPIKGFLAGLLIGLVARGFASIGWLRFNLKTRIDLDSN